MADGTVTLDVETNEKGVEVGMRDIEASVKRMAATVGDAGEKTKIAIQKQVDSISKLNGQYTQQEKKVESLRQKLKEISEQKIETEEYKQLGKEINEIYEKAANLEGELNEWNKLGFSDETGGFKLKEKDLQELIETMAELYEKQEQMKKNGTAYVDPKTFSEYQNIAPKVETEEKRLNDINNRLATSFAALKEKIRECLSVSEEKDRLKKLGENAEISKEQVAKLNAELQKLKERQKELGKAGVGLGYEEFDKNTARIAEINAELKEYQKEITGAEERDHLRELSENAEISEKHIADLNAELQKLKERQGELGKAGVGLGYEEFDKNMVKISEINAKLKEYQKEVTGAEERDHLKELSENAEVSEEHIAKLNAELQKLKERQKELTKAGVGLGYEEFDRNTARIAEINAELKEYQKEVSNAETKSGPLASMCEKLDKMSRKLAQKGIKQLGSSMKSLIRTVEKLSMKLLKLSASSVAGGIRKISAGIFGIHKSANKSTSSIGTVTKAIKTLLKYSIGIRSLYVLMNKLRSAAVEGFKNLAQYSDTTNNSISMLMSSLTQLKNALAAAFNPILTVVAPILTKFINLISQALTYVGMFFGALTGQKTFTKAVSVQQDYAASLDKTADSAKKAAKALEGYLSPIDEINSYDDGSDSSSDNGTGSGYTGPTPDQMFEEVPIKNSIKGIANKIRKLIQQEDWEGLGKFAAQCINKGLKHVYDAISWKKVGPKVTKFCDAFTRSFNSLTDNMDWDLAGRTVGAGITTLVRTFNRLTDPSTGINFEGLGKGISMGLRGMIDEVPWTEAGNALGNRFMIAWRLFDGFVHDMARKNDAGITGWQELGSAVAEAMNGAFDKVEFSDIADSLATGLNGAFDSLYQFAIDFEWTDLAEDIADGINTYISEFKWKENGQKLEVFLDNLCSSLVELAETTDWEEFGYGIGTFLSQIDWKEHLMQVVHAIKETLGGLFDGLEASGTAGKVVAFFIKVFAAIKIAQITGIDSFVLALVAWIGKKLIGSGAVTALSGSLSTLVSNGLSKAVGAFSSLTSVIAPLLGPIGLVGVGAAAVYATSKLAGMVETMQGGNGVGTTFGNTMDNFIQTLQQRGDIISGSATEIWDLKESLEKEGMTAEEQAEATQKIIDKLGEMGVTSEQAEQAFSSLHQQGLITDDMFTILSESIKTLGNDTTNMAQNINLGSQSASDAYDDLRVAIGNLTNQMHLGTDEQGQLLNALERTVDSGGTAQDAYNKVIATVKDMGGNTETAAKIFAEVFPDAVQKTKTSVDTNIVGAQETVTTATGQMKTDAQSNLADVQKAAEDATSGVNTATVTNWGNSAGEVKKNLDQMKQTANLKLGEMQRTVDSHFKSQYNTMTTKWQKASERISQIIAGMTDMINRRMDSLAYSMERAGTRMGNGLAQGVADGASGITQTLNNMIFKVNQTVGNINNALSRVEDAFTFSYRYQNPVTHNYGTYTSWLNLSRVSPVPYLASGAVIPPRSEFLAVLGDQKQGRNLEAPEGLLRKIVREETPQRQDGNTYDVSVNMSGKKILDIILEEGELRRSRNGGKNPFKLGEE